MAMSRLLKAALAVSLLSLPAACGDTLTASYTEKFLKNNLTSAGKGKAAAQPPMRLSDALKASPSPMAALVSRGSNAKTLLQQVDTNGPYRTYFTPGGQSLTFRNGFVTATRGLGNDLMSSSFGETHALISARKSGSGTRTLRYLTGEGRTVELVFDCVITQAGNEHMIAGELNIRTQVMEESCTNEHYSFSNGYQVAPSGMVVSSRQWLSPMTGYAAIDQLRL